MKRLPLLGSMLAIGLTMGTPAVFGHAGHGDEFQAEGGVDRVAVNAETDTLFGIEVTPIAAADDGSATVRVPVAALVADGERQLVFVRYENFYEPVPVTTGATVGDQIEVVEGLSVGEQLVTQGSLALYAESRKTQPTEPATTAESTESAESAEPVEPAEPVATASPEAAESSEPVAEPAEAPETPETPEATTSGLPILPAAVAVGVGAVVVAGVAVASRKQGQD